MLLIIAGVLFIISGLVGLLRPDLFRKFFSHLSEEAFPARILKTRAALLVAGGAVCVILGALL